MMHHQHLAFHLPADISYLNGAYMSPQLKSVEAVGNQALKAKNLPYLTKVDDFFQPVQQLKSAFAKLVHIKEPQRIAIIPAVSYGIATVCRNIQLQKDQEILIVDEQFPSNYYSWERLAREKAAHIRIVNAPSNTNRTQNWNTAILEAIGPNTKVVSMAHVHWADGTVFDLKAIRRKANEVGALLIIDGTQSVGALPFNVSEIQPDALICAGYKWLMGPYSIGLAYYGPAFDDGIPIEENWINRHNSEDFRQLVNYEPSYQAFAGRYSVGEHSNFLLVPMLHTAINQILEWGVDHIQAYAKNLGQEVLDELRSLGCQIECDAERAGHLFGIRPGSKFDLELLKKEMQARQIYVSFRGDAIRVSPHVYNSEKDFDQLFAAFQAARRPTMV